MSKIPLEISEIDKDNQVLRAGMIAELDAVNLYEQMARKAKSRNVKKLLLDIAKEEKTHTGEFLALLLSLDKEQAREILKGRAEVKDKLGKVI
jgi:rubrerythrin